MNPTVMPFDIARIRAEFPALSVTDDGRSRVYFDNPGGTQVPQRVVDRTTDYLVNWNTNSGGAFVTSIRTDEMIDEAHAAMADLLGAASGREIIFGQNMTSLTFSISRALGRTFSAGDELIVTQMDHDANIAPWLLLARDLDLTVRWLPIDRSGTRFDLDALDGLLSPRTRLIAVNYASNALGTINPVAEIARRARAVGALTYVDAVQYVPHGVTDVQALGCDFLACSAYKFFGPHQGIVWGRESLLRELTPYKVRPASDDLPHRFETGTLSHEGMAGTLGAVEYFAWVGTEMGGAAPDATRRVRLVAGMRCLSEYENGLGTYLIGRLREVPGLRIHGITDPHECRERVPTVIFDLDGHAPHAVAEALANANIFVWDGNYYALEVMRHLGFEGRGGLVRVGLAHYNTREEIDLLIDRLRMIAAA